MTELLSVLVADDEYWIRENLRTILDWEKYGFTFLTPATDGEDALHRLSQAPADIVITDINMPYLTGVELIEQIKKRWPGTVVLALSGYSDFEYVRQALVAGALDYLLKPIGMGKLIEVLNKAAQKVLACKQEQMMQSQSQRRLALMASALLDQDFSGWIHESRHSFSSQDAEAQMFKYEQQFSGFHLVLFKIPISALASQTEEASNRVYEWKQLIDAAIPVGQKMIIRYLYHAGHILLICEASAQELAQYLPPLLERMEKQLSSPIQAAVSRGYLSFSDLRKAYDETKSILLNGSCRVKSRIVFVDKTILQAATQRISVEKQRQLELAAHNKDRDLFDQLIEQTGLYRCVQEDWTIIELLHTLSGFAWILRRCAESDNDLEQMTVMENLAETLLNSAEHGDENELYSLMVQFEDEYFDTEPVSHQSLSMRKTVSCVRDEIDAHYFDALSLDSFARRYAVDSSYLSKCFKQTVGYNLMLYLTKARIHEAERLLRETDQSITEISQLVGYDDYAYFSRVFKKSMGRSPRAYREENKP